MIKMRRPSRIKRGIYLEKVGELSIRDAIRKLDNIFRYSTIEPHGEKTVRILVEKLEERKARLEKVPSPPSSIKEELDRLYEVLMKAKEKGF